MPRIDNSQGVIDVVNQAIFEMWGPGVEHFREDFNEDDPGDTPPIDLCRRCFEDLMRNDYINTECDELDHPDYGDAVYQCVVCGEILEENEDG